MRTPEEIKKGLQCIANVRKNGCSASPCGLCKLYVTNYYSGEVCADALAYIDRDGHTVVEDVKGVKTQQYIIRRKLMLKEYGIEIREV